MTLRLALFCLLPLCACADGGNTALDSDHPRIRLAGVVSAEGSPLPHTALSLRVQDTVFQILAERVDTTDATGTYSITVPLDTVLEHAWLFLQVVPLYGSGLGTRLLISPIDLDSFGTLDSTGTIVIVPRVDPGVPHEALQPLTATQVAGTFTGRSIPPLNPLVGGAFWTFTLRTDGDSLVGRYEADFQATTICGNGVGSVTGHILGDTLHLRMVSDSFTGDDIGTRVTLFTAVTYAPSADTIILTYPGQPGPHPCTWGSPAPIRMIR